MKTTRTMLLPLLWPGPAELARRLEACSAEGWNLDAMDAVGALRLTLRRTQVQPFRVSLDYCPAPSVEYRNRWERAGWEYLGLVGKYPLWRTARRDAAVPGEGAAIRARCRKLRAAYRICAGMLGFASALLLVLVVLALCHAAPGRAALAALEAVACGAAAWYSVWFSRACGRMEEQTASCGGEEERSV